MSTYSLFEGGDFMKKIILAVIASTMLLSSVAFASTKTTHNNTDKNKVVSTIHSNGWIHVETTDPH